MYGHSAGGDLRDEGDIAHHEKEDANSRELSLPDTRNLSADRDQYIIDEDNCITVSYQLNRLECHHIIQINVLVKAATQYISWVL